MTAIHFYHLTKTPLAIALPKLLEKAYSSSFRTLLLAGSDDQMSQLNQLLWSYDPNSFLPHGSIKEPYQDQQPILISTMPENHNNANLLFITNGHKIQDTGGYDRIIDMFDGNDDRALTNARARWKSYKDAGLELIYNKQNDAGGWEKAA